MSDEQAVQVVEPKRQSIAVGARGLDLRSFEDMWRFATAVSKTPFVPKGMEKPETIMVAVQMGLELGISPMQALQNIAVINGKPSIYGDLAKGLVMASGLCESFKEWYESPPREKGAEDNRTAVCEVKRVGMEPLRREFSIADAKRAKLWGKAGPWTDYPARMLRWRAVGWAIRDGFPDVIKGIGIREEVEDWHTLPETGTVMPEMLEQPTITPEDLKPAEDQSVRPKDEPATTAETEATETTPADTAVEVQNLHTEVTELRTIKGISPREWLVKWKKGQADMTPQELVKTYIWLDSLPDKVEETQDAIED